MDERLMLWLAVLGAVVLAGVLLHGWWSARKAGPRRPAPLPEAQEPTLEAGALTSQGQDEPGAAGQEAPGDDPAAALLRPLPRRPSARIDPLIDAVSSILLDAPVTGELALAHLPGSRRAGTKPFYIEGLNAQTGEWELPQGGQRYSEFQAGVQMANRSGPLNEIEYSEFVQKLQAFADALSAEAQWPDMLDVVARARELDQFAASHDVQLALLLRARGAAWTPQFIQQVAHKHSFVAGALPGRLVMPAAQEGDPPMLTLSYDAQAALAAADAQTTSLREATLLLDVPQTAQALEPYAAWQEAARGLSRDLEADIVDDRGAPLNLHAFATIHTELAAIYQALVQRDLAAGSTAARRLFS